MIIRSGTAKFIIQRINNLPNHSDKMINTRLIFVPAPVIQRR